jgi:sugar phosphate isomerase/epimerase
MKLGLVIPDLEQRYQEGIFYKTTDTLQEAKVNNIEAHASFLLGKKEPELLELIKELKSRNITIDTVHAPFGEDNDLSSTDATIIKETIDRHIRSMEQMSTVNIPVLTIHPGSRLTPEKESEIPLREKIFRKSLEKLLKQAEKLKIKLAVENMLPLRTGYKIDTIKSILNEFPSPFLGVCFDTGHANVGEGVFETFNTVKEKIMDFHIHDNDGTGDMHLQPPYGNINWTDFFTAVKKINYKRPIMIEAYPWQGRELKWMMQEVEMLKENKRLIKTFPMEHFLKCKKCGHFIYGTESNPICYCNQ